MLKQMASTLWYVPTTAIEEENMFEDYEHAVDLNVKNGEPLNVHSSWRGMKKAWLKISSMYTY